MRMVKMRHPDLRAVVDVPESAVEHHKRARWELVDAESTVKHHPANTSATDPAVVREPVGAESPADDAGVKSTTARRARTEGSA